MKKLNNKNRRDGVVSNIQSSSLMALARFKFLTISQLLEIGVGTTQKSYLWKQMASLRDRKVPLVKCQRFAMVQTKSGTPPLKVEDWYYLSLAGKRCLEDEFQYRGVIKMPIGRGNIPSKDYFHRKRTISFFIALTKWAKSEGIEVPFIHNYYDKTGSARNSGNLRAKTKIEFKDRDFFIPDGAFKLLTKKGEKFFLMEMYNGNDVGRTVNQLVKHAVCLTQRYAHKAYEIPFNKSYLIILIFEQQQLMDATINRISTKEPAFAVIQKYFRCKTVEGIGSGYFFEDWKTLGGEVVGLF